MIRKLFKSLHVQFQLFGILALLFLSCKKENNPVYETVIDIDGNVYQTVTIGTQVWMAENLKTTRFNDGTNIPLIFDDQEWLDLFTSGYSWYNNDEAKYKDTYGALYNWYAINSGKLAPKGWHVPTDDEWTTLTDFVGGAIRAGGYLKESDTSHWKNPNTGAINSYGFNALPGGCRTYYSSFIGIGEVGKWWCSDGYSDYGGYCRQMNYYRNSVNDNPEETRIGCSVRCVKDLPAE